MLKNYFQIKKEKKKRIQDKIVFFFIKIKYRRKKIKMNKIGPIKTKGNFVVKFFLNFFFCVCAL